MKKLQPNQFINGLSIVLLILLLFLVGVYLGNRHAKHTITRQADALLAYQHYYEVAKTIIESDAEQEDSLRIMRDYHLAESEIQKTWYMPLEFPQVANQRDLLSDVIRNYADDNPGCNIMEYVENYIGDSTKLQLWSYAY